MKDHDNPENYSASGNYKRICKALATLVQEIQGLYPEVEPDFCGYDGRGAALEVVLDMEKVPESERDFLRVLLRAIEIDARIGKADVLDGVSLAYVAIRPNPRTQDDLTSFELAEIYMSLIADIAVGGSL